MRPDLIELDLGTIETSLDLHLMLRDRLQFPDYYGENWDAFWDCIRDDEQSSMPTTLRLRGWDALQRRLPRDAKLLRKVLDDLANNRDEVTVEWA